MAHGAPDDSNVALNLDLYRVDDMAELAARLGSIVTYRRSGQVMALEDFSHGLGRWLTFVGGGGDEVALQSDYSCSAGVCPGMTVGGGGGSYAYIEAFFPIWGLERVAAAADICPYADAETVFIALHIYTATTVTGFILNYHAGTGVLEYFDSSGGYTVIDPSLNLLAAPGIFYTMKLTVDIAQRTYVSLLLGDRSYDLSAIPGYTTALVSTPHLVVRIGATGALLWPGTCAVDNIILTRGED